MKPWPRRAGSHVWGTEEGAWRNLAARLHHLWGHVPGRSVWWSPPLAWRMSSFFPPLSLSVKNYVTSKILQIKKVFWYDLYSARFWVSGEIQSWNTFMYSEKNAFLFSFVFILGQFGRDQLRRIPANSTCRRRGREGVTGINRTSSDKRSCEAREKSYK